MKEIKKNREYGRYETIMVKPKRSEEWTEINFDELKKGDTFRMFNLDETPVKDLFNRTEFVATTDAFMSDELKQLTVTIENFQDVIL